MSSQDQQKWDAKYAAGAYESKRYPGAYLTEHLPQIVAALETSGATKPWHALDLACGAGRNSHYLSEHGFEVDAIDISTVGLKRAAEQAPPAAQTINWIQQDLENATTNNFGHYDLVIMMRYVNLPLLQAVTSNLKPGGFVLCENHLRTDAEVVGPKNPAFRVAPGELSETLAGLEIIHTSEEIIRDPNSEHAAVARILARKA
ncbi:MAG: class I SAM-dependent methyltransferase [Gammaproteobacteria bacterium]